MIWAFLAGVLVSLALFILWAFWDYKHFYELDEWDDTYTGSNNHHTLYAKNEWKVASPKVRKVRSDKGKTRKPYTKRTK